MLLTSPRSLVVKPTYQTQFRLVFCWCSGLVILGTSLFSLGSESMSGSDVDDVSEHSEQLLVSSEIYVGTAITVSSKVSDLVNNSGDLRISISDVGSNSKLSVHGVSIGEKGTAPGFKLNTSGVDEPLVSSGVSSWEDLVFLLVCTPVTCDGEALGVTGAGAFSRGGGGGGYSTQTGVQCSAQAQNLDPTGSKNLWKRGSKRSETRLW